MKIIALLLVVLVVTVTTAVSGCTSPEAITSPEEAQETLKDVSIDIGELEDTIDEIDSSLG